ncbi:Hypothetical_protein [Hexamita inflata]|uniref:Hypothetical_protein n=1 Tax=Hexamita inflata TaxID=28002 RepID=A0AA86TLX9_9EUKA|nr:Hypothetical protein HINF_LOCUS8955 [Hexamita inflata]
MPLAILILDGSTLNRGILPSAADLTEPHLRKKDAARNEKRDQMNPSSITLNKAGISAMPLQLQRRTPSLIVQLFYYRHEEIKCQREKLTRFSFTCFELFRM